MSIISDLRQMAENRQVIRLVLLGQLAFITIVMLLISVFNFQDAQTPFPTFISLMLGLLIIDSIALILAWLVCRFNLNEDITFVGFLKDRW